MKNLIILLALLVTLQHAKAIDSGVNAYETIQEGSLIHDSIAYDSAENCVAINMGILKDYDLAVSECEHAIGSDSIREQL